MRFWSNIYQVASHKLKTLEKIKDLWEHTRNQIEKNMIFLRKIVIFHTKYPKNFRDCF